MRRRRTMDANIQTLSTLFGRPVSYRIPVFQRPYAWGKEKQWRPLWNDVQRMAEKVLKGPDTEPTHFMGAIVLWPRGAASGLAAEYIVVDGQQRLTTLQILVRAVQQSLQNLNYLGHVSRLSRLTVNDNLAHSADPNSDIKVHQSNRNDLQSFQDVIRGVVKPGTDLPLRPIGEAYLYFYEEATRWLDDGLGEDDDPRAEALVSVLKEHLKLASIDLGDNDKPHFIFSVLNARAEPLRQSDHIKNTVMYRADVIDDASKANELWGPFDNNLWWRRSTREGRLNRIHLDRFLNYWVIMRRRTEVNADSISSEFDRYLESESPVDIDRVAGDIRSAAIVYRHLEEGRMQGIESFLHRMSVMGIGVAIPLLMRLYTENISDSESVPDEQRQRSVQAIESYLVRRMLCGLSSMGLNKVFLELLARVDNNSVTDTGESIVTFLSGQTADSRIWPNNEMIRESLIGNPLRGNRKRRTMILEAIEYHLRTDLMEGSPIVSPTIEHIMPETWETNWALPEGQASDEATRSRRARTVREIGNLTLVSGRLNSTLSNAAWPQKRVTLRKHTALRLNWELLEGAAEVWSEEAIRDRSRQMAEWVIEIWPAHGEQ